MSTKSDERPAPSYSNPDPNAAAIIGMSISAPGGEARGLDTEAFFEFLSNRGSGTVTVPADRWNAEAYHGSGPGKIVTTKGAFIPEFAAGDLQEFGITPAEASRMKTAQIVLLHQAFNALQRSGVDYRATNTGVYVGCTGYDMPFEVDDTRIGPYDMTGQYLSVAANRINYVFDLLGPSVLVDSACSSALTAMHLALQALRNGDCEQAVVAGFNFAGPLETISYSQIGVLSPDGISKSFDDDANGYARGDVAGAVVIKRHDIAVKDFDRILATVVGTSLTSCGSIMGSLTTPSAEAQTRAIRNAYREAGLKPHQVDFVELHGTGTVVGDSLEVNAAGAVFADGRNGREILIGSVKSNVGHGEMGAYMSSLIKVILMLNNGKILPNGYFEKPSRKIQFEKYNLRVPVEVEEMVAQNPTLGLIASISSFGIGGACGHSVLRAHESRPSLRDIGQKTAGPFLFAVGGLSPKSTQTLTERYNDLYASTDPLLLSEHLGGRARQLPWRTYAIAHSLGAAEFADPVLVGKRPNPVVFCFSGQGPQHWQQGRVLMTTYSAFRDSIYACDEVHKQYTGRSFLKDTNLFIDHPDADSPLASTLIWPANIISVAITFFQIALFDLLISLGIKPDAVVGHSIGETAVLYASGAMPRDMAVKIAIARGRALSLIDNIGGTMVAISGSNPDTVQSYIDAVFALANLDNPNKQELYIAALNSPTDVGVSGSKKLVNMLTEYISNFADGVTARVLRVSTAVHSPLVDACEAVYRAELEFCFAQYSGPFIPTRRVMSSVTGKWKTDSYDIDYLWNNLRRPVLFSSAIPNIIDHFGENTTFVEIAPHPVLSQYIKQMGAYDSLAGSVRPPSRRQQAAGIKTSEHHALLQTIGRLLVCGINNINFSVLNGCPVGAIEGPSYPFQWKIWPFADRDPSYLKRLLPSTPPLNSSRLRVAPNLPGPWMGDHVVDQSTIVPAAAYIEMALEFEGVTQVWDCHFDSACALSESPPATTLEVALDGIMWTVRSSSTLQTLQGDLDWTRSGPEFDIVHAHGKLGYGKALLGPDSPETVDVDAVLSRCFSSYPKDHFYRDIETLSQFGPRFSRVENISMNAEEAICWIRGNVEDLDADGYIFYPPLMDAVFQAGLGWTLLADKVTVDGMDRILYLPHSLRRGYRNSGSSGPLVLPDRFRCYVKLVEWALDHHVVNAYVLDDDGAVLYTFEGLRFNFLEAGEKSWPTQRYTVQWQPRDLPLVAIEDSSQADQPDEEEFQLLHNLDCLAMKYTSSSLKMLPENFEPPTFDRKRYLSWARSQAERFAKTPEVVVNVGEKYRVLLELAQRIGNNQKDIMKTSTAAVEALFKDDIMSRIYELPPFVGSIFDDAVAQFVRLVKDIAAGGKRVIRVLEVGSGTGRFTALLGQALLDARLDEICHIEYVATDISISLAQESCKKSPWTVMTPKVLDLRIPVSQQGFEAESFDIITAFDVLHAVPDVKSALSSLRSLLYPGGYLTVIDIDGAGFRSEGIPGTIWMDFVFGCFSEWMGVLEHRTASRHCTLTVPEWKEVLEASGFASTGFLTAPPSTFSHLAFTSRRSHDTPSVSQPLPSDDTQVLYRFHSGLEVELVHFVASLDASKAYTLWLYTDSETYNASLIGITRSIRREYNQWTLKCVIFHSSWSASQQEEYIRGRLLPLTWTDPEILVDSQGVMRVPRVVAVSPPPQMEARTSHAIEFDEKNIWRAYPSPLGPSDVEILVGFINISTTFPECCEFSGTVVGIGSDLGREELLHKKVFGIAHSKPGTTIICDRSRVAIIPDALSLLDAAAVVGRLVFISSVIRPTLAHIHSKSPKILLHAGDSPSAAVAAYDYITRQGYDCFVTAKDPSKCIIRGDCEIHDSRRIDVWTTRVRDWAERGVDLAINFDLDDSVTTETTQLLAKGATLLQVEGDIPKHIHRGYHYFAVDYDAILDKDIFVGYEIPPDAIASLVPSAPRIHKLSEPELVIASEQARVSSSTVLIDLQTPNPSLPIHKAGILKGTPVFEPRATYVIIGGVGGLGVAIARCLVDNGAKHITLTSRSGEAGFRRSHLIHERKLLNALRSRPGVVIDVIALDCLDVEGTKLLFENSPRPIAGVFFLPLFLNDQIFSNLDTDEKWRSVSEVKVQGLNVLLKAIDPSTLDFLVLTSSIVTVIGSDGQANYAAAQHQMEAIGAGLPNTISIVVPPITDSGAFARLLSGNEGRSVMHEKYKSLGMSARRLAEHCVDAIWTLGNKDRNAVYIPPMNWKSIVNLIPSYSQSFVRHLLVKETSDNLEVSASKQTSIRAVCASVLSMDIDAVEENIPLSSYGLDSLTSVRLSGILKSQFGISVTQLQLLSNYVTVEKLQSMMEEQHAASTSEAGKSTSKRTASQSVAAASSDETIVPLNVVSEGRPLFMIHGAGGGIGVMRKLAEEVNHPVFGVQDTSEAPINGTLSQLARFYLAKIRAISPRGPYRIGGFSFGATIAFRIAALLRAEGERVELLVMLESAPSLIVRRDFQEWTRSCFIENRLKDDIMAFVGEMASCGVLEDAGDISNQFTTHFDQIATGGAGIPWVARFYKAYSSHLMMGLRASTDLQERLAGEWPAQRTLLVRATVGMSTRTQCSGASNQFDLEKWTSNIESLDLPGSHIGILNPSSGLPTILNRYLDSV